MAFQLNCDGGARGNPGIAGCGFALTTEDEIVLSGGWYLGEQTNNYAEYCGLVWGLQNALAKGVKELEVRADSELMVKQMNGVYKVKNAGLKPLYAQAKVLAAQFDRINIQHVYRAQNKLADQRANEAMDALGPVGSYLVDYGTREQDDCGTEALF